MRFGVPDLASHSKHIVHTAERTVCRQNLSRRVPWRLTVRFSGGVMACAARRERTLK